MRAMIEKYASLLQDGSGVQAILAEMDTIYAAKLTKIMYP